MKCNQLGGPDSCQYELQANIWEEMQTASRNHAMENMDSHKEAMDAMMEMMKDEEAMHKWMEEKRQEFESLPEDE